jgi:hypothetical protein
MEYLKRELVEVHVRARRRHLFLPQTFAESHVPTMSVFDTTQRRDMTVDAFIFERDREERRRHRNALVTFLESKDARSGV